MKALDARKTIQATLGVVADGKIGPKSRAALERLIALPDDAEWPEPVIVTTQPASGELVDERSEKAIATLHPKVQPIARALVKNTAAKGITIEITSGTRSYDEQNALYEQGRSKPGKIVTNARGGYSNHNFGIAFDVTIFKNGQPVWESPLYKTVGELGESLGLTWGGRWMSIQDEPHFELKPNWAEDMSESSMLSSLRNRHSTGQDAFA